MAYTRKQNVIIIRLFKKQKYVRDITKNCIFMEYTEFLVNKTHTINTLDLLLINTQLLELLVEQQSIACYFY